MQKDSVNIIRELLGDKIGMLTDNAKLYSENDQATKLIWDQVNGLVYVIMTNNNYYNKDKKPILFECFEDDVIQYMYKLLSHQELTEILDKLLASGIITEDTKKSIQSEFDKINNNLL